MAFFPPLFDDCRWKWVCSWTWQTLLAFMTATTLKKKASNMWSSTVKGMSSFPSVCAGPMCSNSSVAHCFSHGECPSADTTAMFIRLCEHFIERNPTELIGESLFLVFQPCCFSSFPVLMPAVRGPISVPASLNGTHKHPLFLHALTQSLTPVFPVAFLYLFTIQSFFEIIFLKSFVWFRIRLWPLYLGQQFAYVFNGYRYGLRGIFWRFISVSSVASCVQQRSSFLCICNSRALLLHRDFSLITFFARFLMTEYQTKLYIPQGRGSDPGVLLCNCVWVLCVCACGSCEKNNTAPTERRAGERTRADVASDRLGFRGHLSIVHVIAGHCWYLRLLSFSNINCILDIFAMYY